MRREDVVRPDETRTWVKPKPATPRPEAIPTTNVITIDPYKEPYVEGRLRELQAERLAALFNLSTDVIASRFDGTPLEPIVLTVRKIRHFLPVSIEQLDDSWLPVPRYWFREEWEVEVARLRRVRRILEAQPLASIKAAATRDVTRALRVRRFPHVTWETPLRWYDLDDEGRPLEMD